MKQSEIRKKIEEDVKAMAKENPDLVDFALFPDGGSAAGFELDRLYEQAKRGDREAAAKIKELEKEGDVAFPGDSLEDEAEETVPAYDNK